MAHSSSGSGGSESAAPVSTPASSSSSASMLRLTRKYIRLLTEREEDSEGEDEKNDDKKQKQQNSSTTASSASSSSLSSSSSSSSPRKTPISRLIAAVKLLESNESTRIDYDQRELVQSLTASDDGYVVHDAMSATFHAYDTLEPLRLAESTSWPSFLPGSSHFLERTHKSQVEVRKNAMQRIWQLIRRCEQDDGRQVMHIRTGAMCESGQYYMRTSENKYTLFDSVTYVDVSGVSHKISFPCDSFLRRASTFVDTVRPSLLILLQQYNYDPTPAIDSHGNTLLHKTAMQADDDAFMYLLTMATKRVDITHKNAYGENAIHYLLNPKRWTFSQLAATWAKILVTIIEILSDADKKTIVARSDAAAASSSTSLPLPSSSIYSPETRMQLALSLLEPYDRRTESVPWRSHHFNIISCHATLPPPTEEDFATDASLRSGISFSPIHSSNPSGLLYEHLDERIRHLTGPTFMANYIGPIDLKVLRGNTCRELMMSLLSEILMPELDPFIPVTDLAKIVCEYYF